MSKYQNYQQGLIEGVIEESKIDTSEVVKKITALVAQYGKTDVKIAEDSTRKGVRTIIIGVSEQWKAALVSNLERMKFAKKGDTYALQTKGASLSVPGFEHTIIIRLPVTLAEGKSQEQLDENFGSMPKLASFLEGKLQAVVSGRDQIMLQFKQSGGDLNMQVLNPNRGGAYYPVNDLNEDHFRKSFENLRNAISKIEEQAVVKYKEYRKAKDKWRSDMEAEMHKKEEK